MPSEITAALAPGEAILWSAQPRPYVFLLRGLPAIFYGITWSVLGAFWYHGSGGIGEYSAFEGWWRLIPLGSLPFILCGFSFFFYPINLGARARHTWYVVTNQRIFIARLHYKKPIELRVFTPEEMGPPHLIKRFDGLYEIVLVRSAQDKPYLIPRLESGFFGIKDGEAAEAAILATKEHKNRIE
jgi:hypothetical protein